MFCGRFGSGPGATIPFDARPVFFWGDETPVLGSVFRSNLTCVAGRVEGPIFTHSLIRSRKTGRLADLLAEATSKVLHLQGSCEPSPATGEGGEFCVRSWGYGTCLSGVTTLLDDGYIKEQTNIRSFPTTWFIDRTGLVAYVQEGLTPKLLEEFSWRIESLR